MIGLWPSGSGVVAEARGRGGETPGELEEARKDLKLAEGLANLDLDSQRPWPSYPTAHHLPSHPKVFSSFPCKSLADYDRRSYLALLTVSV